MDRMNGKHQPHHQYNLPDSFHISFACPTPFTEQKRADSPNVVRLTQPLHRIFTPVSEKPQGAN
jgi:hypothetical protein